MGYFFLVVIYWLYCGICGYEGLGYGDIKYFVVFGVWYGW